MDGRKEGAGSQSCRHAVGPARISENDCDREKLSANIHEFVGVEHGEYQVRESHCVGQVRRGR